MAEFFDKASEKVTKAANYVAQKTKKLASDTKLSFDIKNITPFLKIISFKAQKSTGQLTL